MTYLTISKNILIYLLHFKAECDSNINSKLAITHPIFTSSIIYDYHFNNGTLFDMFEDEILYKKYLNYYQEHYIDTAKDVSDLLCFLNKAWILTFIKLFLSIDNNKDSKQYCANILLEYWTTIEFPFKDVNVTYDEIIELLELSDKSIIPDQENIDSLNDKITIYRGIKDLGNMEIEIKGCWTLNKDEAYNFGKRLNNSNIFYIYEGIVNKKDIIAWLNQGTEDEIIIDYRKIRLINKYIYKSNILVKTQNLIK